MEGQSNVLLIILLFILRLGVPVLVTVAIAYGSVSYTHLTLPTSDLV